MHSIQYNNFMRHGNDMDHSRILSDQLEMLQTSYMINERPHASFRNLPSFDWDMVIFFLRTAILSLSLSSFTYVNADSGKVKKTKIDFQRRIWFEYVAHVCDS